MTRTQPADDTYQTQLDERIRSIRAASWGDEANKQGVLSGLLAARELYLHIQGQPSASAAAADLRRTS